MYVDQIEISKRDPSQSHLNQAKQELTLRQQIIPILLDCSHPNSNAKPTPKPNPNQSRRSLIVIDYVIRLFQFDGPSRKTRRRGPRRLRWFQCHHSNLLLKINQLIIQNRQIQKLWQLHRLRRRLSRSNRQSQMRWATRESVLDHDSLIHHTGQLWPKNQSGHFNETVQLRDRWLIMTHLLILLK